MSASQNNLSVNVNQQDANGVDIVNRLIGVFAFAGAVGVAEQYLVPDTSSHALPQPATTSRQVLIENKHASAIVTLVGTPSGGSSVTLAKLGPGDVFIYWNLTTAAGTGYTALSVTSDTASTPLEVFIGG